MSLFNTVTLIISAAGRLEGMASNLRWENRPSPTAQDVKDALLNTAIDGLAETYGKHPDLYREYVTLSKQWRNSSPEQSGHLTCSQFIATKMMETIQELN